MLSMTTKKHSKNDLTPNSRAVKFYIGTMSGTSADGLDIVIARISNKNNVNLIHSFFCTYPHSVNQRIKQLQTVDKDVLLNQYQRNLDELDQELAIFFAKNIQLCLSEAGIDKEQISAIGNHGQTILHQPNASKPFSLQICNAQSLANACSIPVIADFRKADIEQGGQGAPLMPAFHAAILNEHPPCAVVNIGGISNTSILSRECVLGFDNGPGNTLMDAWIAKHLKYDFDKSGEWARSGTVNNNLLKTLLNDPYFSLETPKSTGQDAFNIQWLERNLSTLNPDSANNIPAEDVQATLCDLTAKSITDDIQCYGSRGIDNIIEIFVCGGGAKNHFLMERLQHFAGETVTVKTTNQLGIDADWVEALGFAWLAYCHDHKITGNLPSVTGAKQEVILGNRFDATAQLK